VKLCSATDGDMQVQSNKPNKLSETNCFIIRTSLDQICLKLSSVISTLGLYCYFFSGAAPLKCFDADRSLPVGILER
jgi:hypothetical protein